MNYQDARKKLNEARLEIASIRKSMREIQAAAEGEPVEDYVFETPDARVRLSELFGDRDELILIHNMGKSCPYCTLWADGFNGLFDHLDDRADFVVSSPDAPSQQREFAASRGWRFPMVSHRGSSFAEDMGYKGADGWHPGVSVFIRSDSGIQRIADAPFGPGDDFCSLWHLLDLLPDGPAGWQPRYRYD